MILGAIAGGAAKLAGKLFGGIRSRREKRRARQKQRQKKQDKKLQEQTSGLLASLGLSQGDSTNVPDAPGNDIVAQAGNALLAKFQSREDEADVVTVADREITKTPAMTPIMWIGLGVVALALFGKKLFK
jgi:hypothetical protein